MTALERAQSDLERGEHWLARRRLESYLASKGYDPEILNKLGEIAFDMRDTYSAGRMWLTGTAEGSHVDRAIETYVRYAGSCPRQIVSELPRAVRLTSIGEYPPVVQERLERLGLARAIVVFGSRRSRQYAGMSWKGRFMMLAVILLLTFGVISCVVGMLHISSCISGGR